MRFAILIISFSIISLALIHFKISQNNSDNSKVNFELATISFSNGEGDSFAIKYNAHGKVAKLVSIDQTGNVMDNNYKEYKYVNDNIFKITQVGKSTNTTCVYSYNSSNLIKEIIEFDSSTYYTSTRFTYYENGEVKNKVRYHWKGEDIIGKDSVVLSDYRNGRPGLKEKFYYSNLLNDYVMYPSVLFFYDENMNLIKKKVFNDITGNFEVSYEATYNHALINPFSVYHYDSEDPNKESKDRNTNLISFNREYSHYCNTSFSINQVVEREHNITVLSSNELDFPLIIKKETINVCTGKKDTMEYKFTYR